MTSQDILSSSGLMRSENLSGTVAGTSRQAPLSERLQMMHSKFGEVPYEIEPPLKARTRGVRRLSSILLA